MRWSSTSLALALVLWMSGCTRWAALDLPASESAPEVVPGSVLPEGFVNHAVPRLFSRNLGPNCALISLQMVLAYQGIRASLDQLQSQLGARSRGGAIRFSDLIDIAHQYDVRLFYVHEPSTHQLRALIAAEFALLVASKGYGSNTGHARVLIGYQGLDDERGTFYLLDPNYGGPVEEPARRHVLQAHPFAVLVLDRSQTREDVLSRLAPYFHEGEPLPEIRSLAAP